ncbi:MAG TPA: ATP-binding protein [Acidimicrobiales bacterium]|nr:ATP-binding protein [Acidimicrobiales bacterium]
MASTLHPNGPDERDTRVEVPIRPEAIVSARSAVRRAAVHAGLGGDRIDDMLVAVSEACTNALEANQRAGSTQPLLVTITVTQTSIEVCVTDTGSGFQPDALPQRPPLADPGHLDIERGWGIQLMRELVDELVYDVTGPGTTVCLRMTLAAASS